MLRVVARLLQLFGNTSNNNAFRISILAALPPALFFLALKNEACRAILGQRSNHPVNYFKLHLNALY